MKSAGRSFGLVLVVSDFQDVYKSSGYHLQHCWRTLRKCTLVFFFASLKGARYKEDIAFENYNFTADPYFNFTLQPGEQRCLEIEIIDDNVTEQTYKYFHFTLGVYNNVPTNCQNGYIGIRDNDSKLINEFITINCSTWSFI